MTADMVIRFFENYGWMMTVLATSGIVFVGCLKALGLFSKLKPKAKKYVYFACSCVVSIVACTIYLCVNGAFVWADWGMTVVCIIGYTMAIYGLYENTGIRALVKKILFTPMKNLLKSTMSLVVSKSMSKDKMMLLAKDLGSDILIQLANEAQQNEKAVEIVADTGNDEIAAVENSIQNHSENEVKYNTDKLIKNNFFS